MKTLSDYLQAFRNGELTKSQILEKIAASSIVDLSHTRLDMQRRARTGQGEVIFGQSKTTAQILEIADELRARGENVLATRLSQEAIAALQKNFPEARASEQARLVSIGENPPVSPKSFIAIVSAGTSDLSVAEEARLSAEFFGSRVKTFYDCGVAGLHRLTARIEEIRAAKAIVAVAGMEGALASVVAGLVKTPVIAVPTSVGYGASFGGLAALLAMMNSCANGVSVVNIDNGFGAGYNAHLINSL